MAESGNIQESLPDSSDDYTSRPRGVDVATLSGILGAVALTGMAIAASGSPLSFVDMSGLLIVLGGTILITATSFSWADIRQTLRELGRSAGYKMPAPQDVALDMLRIAKYTHRHGILRLRGVVLNSLHRDQILHKGLQLVLNGTAENEIARILSSDIASSRVHSDRAVCVLRRAAETSPAMGLIGTLIGLVQMLGHLDNPAAIGPGMSIALLTTFYGAVMAYMILGPLGSRLERNGQEEALVHQIWLTTVLSIERRESPSQLELHFNSILPPGQRLPIHVDLIRQPAGG